MAPQTETFMLLKVDLDCSCCYKKVKKLLCSIPEVKDQEYNEKENTVKIRVVCCRPERIRDKIRCKGGKSIICIEILEPPKPKPDPPKPDPEPKPEPPKCKPVLVPGCPPPQPPCRPTCCSDCYEGRTTGPCYNGFGYGYGYDYGYGYGYSCPTPPSPQPRGGRCYNDYGCPPPRGCGSRPVGYCVIQENPSSCAIM